MRFLPGFLVRRYILPVPDTQDKSAVTAKDPANEKVRVRYLGSKRIVHTLTGLEFVKHVMHTMRRSEFEDLIHWTSGEEFEEIK